jgi:hypothetical protein
MFLVFSSHIPKPNFLGCDRQPHEIHRNDLAKHLWSEMHGHVTNRT